MDSIQRFSRKCAHSGRDLLPGDQYISVLQDTVRGIERQDFAIENWPGEPEDTICWWKAQIPLPSQVRIRWAPDRVIRAYFRALLENQNYPVLNVLAIAIVRRKLMQMAYEDPLDEQTSPDQDDDSPGGRRLTLTDRLTGDSYTFPEIDLVRVDLSKIQAELEEHLFTDQIELEDDEETAGSEPEDEA